jgi:hypothetical protein
MRLTISQGRVDWRTRGIWHPGPPISDQEFAAARHGFAVTGLIRTYF